MFEISVGSGRTRRCDGVTRRDALTIGSLGALGLTLPALLQAQARAGQEPAGSTSPRAKSVILVYLGGGLSHHDSFDLKPDAPEEIRGKYKPIPTVVPGLQIGEKLPMMAGVMDRLTLVRSGAHNNDHHETATNWVLCGKFGTPFGDHPAMGAVVSHQLGPRGELPPYVAIPRNPSFTWELGKSAYLGGRYESFKTGDPSDANFKVRDVAPVETPSELRSNRRRNLLEAVDGLARRVEGNDQITSYGEFRQRAAAMILSEKARNGFVLDGEDPRLRDRYGRTTFGQSCLLARRLIERDVRFVTVNFGGWDHHARIYDGLEHKLPDFDRGFSALIEDLDTRGLLAETLVIALGEFGRTPKINKDAGRDHWGPAASMLFAGAGVARGRVIGATDKLGAYVTTRPVPPADVSWTIYESLGVNPLDHLMTPDGRPMAILDAGEPIGDLYA